MSGDDDRPDYLDREKKSFSELDRLRRERRSGGGGQRGGPGASRRAAAQTRAARQQAEQLFSGGKAAEREGLGRALLDARGTAALADACRAYRDAVGAPTESRHISCFLDAGEPELVLVGLAAAREAQGAGRLEVGAGLRTQLRMLAQEPDDAVAEAAEELLELI